MNRRQILAAVLFTPVAAAMAAGSHDASANEKKEKAEGNRTYMMIDTLSASIMRPSGERGVITVEAGLDVPDPVLRRRAELLIPRLRSTYGEFLQTHVAGLARGAPVNADYLALQFQRRTDQALGQTGAKFLIGSILMN